MAKTIVLIVLLVSSLFIELPNAHSKGSNSFFFPYHGCIVGKLENISRFKHFIFLDVYINEVLKGGFKKGKKITLTISDEPMIKHNLDKLLTQKNDNKLLAFAFDNPESIKVAELKRYGKLKPNVVPIRTLSSLGMGESKLHKAKIQQLKERLKNIPKTKVESKEAFKNFLKNRWTVKRIKDFCRPENHRVFADPETSYIDWEGKLHDEKLLDGKEITWSAKVYKDVPISFVIYAKGEGNRLWQLEHNYKTNLPNWSEDDYLKFRFSRTLLNSLYVYREIHGRNSEWKKLVTLFIYDGNDKILRNKDKTIKAYSRKLGNGSTLIVNLDHNLSIEDIKVNGKNDKLWNIVYKQTNENIEKVNKSLSDGTYSRKRTIAPKNF